MAACGAWSFAITNPQNYFPEFEALYSGLCVQKYEEGDAPSVERRSGNLESRRRRGRRRWRRPGFRRGRGRGRHVGQKESGRWRRRTTLERIYDASDKRHFTRRRFCFYDASDKRHFTRRRFRFACCPSRCILRRVVRRVWVPADQGHALPLLNVCGLRLVRQLVRFSAARPAPTDHEHVAVPLPLRRR